jgi:hypothetical protein
MLHKLLLKLKIQSGSRFEQSSFLIISLLFVLFALFLVSWSTFSAIHNDDSAFAFKPTNNLPPVSPNTSQGQQQTVPAETGTVLTGNAIITSYLAELNAEHEIPPIDSAATGTAIFNVTGEKMKYEINLIGISKVKSVHLHDGRIGENGDILVDLPTCMECERTSNGLIITGNIASSDPELKGKTVSDLAAAMAKGEVYINIHTLKYPDGAIRGEIR